MIVTFACVNSYLSPVIVLSLELVFLGCRRVLVANAYTHYSKPLNDYNLYPYGTVAVASCSGRDKSSSRVRTCQDSGEWDGHEYECN